jgi:hypothetical protein
MDMLDDAMGQNKRRQKRPGHNLRVEAEEDCRNISRHQ